MKMYRKFFGLLSSGLLMIGGIVAVTAPSPVYAQEDEEQRPRRSQTLDPAVARVLQEVFELQQAEDYNTALTRLNGLISSRGDRMKAYDKSITYQLRGSTYASLENYRAALRDFQTAIDSGGLDPTAVNGLRYAIAQLNFALEDYNGAIRGLQAWINSGGTPDANAYYLLAAAYTQVTPANYRQAVRPAEQAVSLRPEPRKNDHDLLNQIYSELNENGKRGTLLEKMINLWPDNRSYWTQLSGLYSQSGKDKDAFSVLEVAYRAGLLEREAELLTLVQYYSFFDNPYRGARLMEREMQAGIIKRNVNNLKLLSQLWSQSREHKRAIPILEEAARLDDNGELYYRLGQVLIADEQYAKGEQALANARRKGGLTSKQLGDSWLLTGTARFSRAGDDPEVRSRARQAYVNASRYDCCRRQGNSWVAYIDAIVSTEKAQDRLQCSQEEEERQTTIDRLRQQVQVCRLQRAADGDCSELENRLTTTESTEPAICIKNRGGSASSEAESAQSTPDASTVSTDGAAEEGADEATEPETAN